MYSWLDPGLIALRSSVLAAYDFSYDPGSPTDPNGTPYPGLPTKDLEGSPVAEYMEAQAFAEAGVINITGFRVKRHLEPAQFYGDEPTTQTWNEYFSSGGSGCSSQMLDISPADTAYPQCDSALVRLLAAKCNGLASCKAFLPKEDLPGNIQVCDYFFNPDADSDGNPCIGGTIPIQYSVQWECGDVAPDTDRYAFYIPAANAIGGNPATAAVAGEIPPAVVSSHTYVSSLVNDYSALEAVTGSTLQYDTSNGAQTSGSGYQTGLSGGELMSSWLVGTNGIWINIGCTPPTT